ncbi:hypothetical protein Avbf_15521 [Armadillidium vulgare]|nr:hypothetical protein Avbf_15521 [Armadillidium vulgare]
MFPNKKSDYQTNKILFHTIHTEGPHCHVLPERYFKYNVSCIICDYIIESRLSRMEEIVLCSICLQQFDSLHFIPKILECGHTFCSPCIDSNSLQEEHPFCPNCRAQTEGIASSLPINYYVLNVVDIYKSMSFSESEIVTSIDDMRKKCVERKEILSKTKSSITLSLEVLDKCLEKLEQLTLPGRRVNIVNVKKILNEVKGDLKKTMVCDNLKSTVSILLSDFHGSYEYLEEIYKRIYNEEKIFAVRKVEDKIKYGKVSKYESKLFFHSLSLSEVPKDSSLIWISVQILNLIKDKWYLFYFRKKTKKFTDIFDDLKQCATDTNFYTFLEICCNSKRLTRLAIIKMFDKQQSHHFIKMCTGE